MLGWYFGRVCQDLYANTGGWITVAMVSFCGGYTFVHPELCTKVCPPQKENKYLVFLYVHIYRYTYIYIYIYIYPVYLFGYVLFTKFYPLYDILIYILFSYEKY